MSRKNIVKDKLNAVWEYVTDEELDEFDKIIENVGYTSYLSNKLESSEWPAAVDPVYICDQTSEEDKKIRGSAVYNLYVSYRLSPGAKFLDYGCGEAYVTRYAEKNVDLAVGYDISRAWNCDSTEKMILTEDLEKVRSFGPYDAILLYDVLDHVVNTDPAEVLINAKSMLNENGTIILRLHPWCSRHGTHLWNLNKMHAHLVFSEEQLAKMGHVGLPTVKITNPPETYSKWFAAAGLRETWNKFTYEQTGPFFDNNPLIKDRIINSLGMNCLPYNLIEQTFYDYVLVPLK